MPKKTIAIDMKNILSTVLAKKAWEQYREYLKLKPVLWTKAEKQVRHKIYWEWLNALDHEPLDVKLKLGEFCCQVFDNINYVDAYTQASIENCLGEKRSIINLYKYKNYENDPIKLRWIAMSGAETMDNPYSSQPLPSAVFLLQHALKINPNELNCKRWLFFIAIAGISAVIKWALDAEFHYHVDKMDLTISLNEAMQWASELEQRELWDKLVRKARLIELNRAIITYFAEHAPMQQIIFKDYLIIKKENYHGLMTHWPSWFQLTPYSVDYYSDDVITDVRLQLEKLYPLD